MIFPLYSYLRDKDLRAKCMMNFINGAYILLILLSLSVFQPLASSSLSESKESLMSQYDSKVRAEKIAFLKLYGLSEHDVDNFPQEYLDQMKITHDEMVSEMLKQKQTQVLTSEVLRAMKKVEKVAQHVMAESGLNNIMIIHESDFEQDDVGVTESYQTGMVYIMLNVEIHEKNLDLFADLLRHEASHIVHQDNLIKEIIQCIAWSNSNNEREEILEKSNLFCRSFETRADVYAVVHSPGYAKEFIHFLRGLSNDGTETHPKPSERVAVLERIQACLGEATA